VRAGRHHPSRSGGPAVKRLAAGMRRLVPDALRRDRQDRWAAVFGRIAGYSFAVAVVTGVPLLPFFRPSMATVVYHGSYRLLDGVTMSQAYQSVLAWQAGGLGRRPEDDRADCRQARPARLPGLAEPLGGRAGLRLDQQAPPHHPRL
jgi:hypothetical protein